MPASELTNERIRTKCKHAPSGDCTSISLLHASLQEVDYINMLCQSIFDFHKGVIRTGLQTYS